MPNKRNKYFALLLVWIIPSTIPKANNGKDKRPIIRKIQYKLDDVSRKENNPRPNARWSITIVIMAIILIKNPSKMR